MPGGINWITPPYAQVALQFRLTAGLPPIRTVGEPGTHGIGTGTQGIGVSTPSAAAVAATTVGLATEVHIPNGGMLAPVSESVMGRFDSTVGRPTELDGRVGDASEGFEGRRLRDV